MMRQLLVLGGNGFVGRAVCRAALRRNWTVSSLSRSGQPACKDLDKVNWIKGSALDRAALEAALKGKTCVVHSIGTLFESPPNRTYEVLNHQTLSTLLSYDVPVVGYVSAARFDPLINILLRGYYESKNAAEKDLLSWEAKGHGKAVIFRPGLVYGWDRWITVPLAFCLRILSLFTACIFPPPVQVDRLADRIVDALESPERQLYEPKDL